MRRKTWMLPPFVVLAMCWGCPSASAEETPTELPVFTLEKKIYRSMLPGMSQEYRIDIYRDMSVVFDGVVSTRVIGKAQGQIGRQQFEQIRVGFIDIRFNTLQPIYEPTGTYVREGDGEIALTFRHDGGVSNIRVLDGGDAPPGFRLLVELIKRNSGARQWACPMVVRGADVCDFPD